MPDNGAAVERREALPPPSMGARAPEAVAPGNRERPWARGGLRQCPPEGGLAPPPWRLPALHSRKGRKTGTSALPASPTGAAERWLSEKQDPFIPRSSPRTRGPATPRQRLDARIRGHERSPERRGHEARAENSASCPALCRASTSFFTHVASKTWMAGTSPAMTERVLTHSGQRLAIGGHRFAADQHKGNDAVFFAVVDPVVDGAALHQRVARLQRHHHAVVQLHVDLA